MTTYCRRCAVSVMVAQGMALTAIEAIQGAPLEPVETYITTSISGHARMQPATQGLPVMDAFYSGSNTATRFSSGGLRLGDGFQLGDSPSFRARAAIDSLAGVGLTKLADNEYVLTLSSEAGGLYTPDASMPLSLAALDAQSHVQVQTSFKILGFPNQPRGTPATIHYRLEHFGTLHNINNLQVTTGATLYLSSSASQPGFEYTNSLKTPTLPTGFEDVEFTGTRNYFTEGSITSSVDSIITLNATLDSKLGPPISMPNPSIRYGADSRFDSGLRLYMTVMPEPATALLLVAGSSIAGIKRRRRRCG